MFRSVLFRSGSKNRDQRWPRSRDPMQPKPLHANFMGFEMKGGSRATKRWLWWQQPLSRVALASAEKGLSEKPVWQWVLWPLARWLFLSLSPYLTHSLTLSHTHTYTGTHTLSPFLSHSLTRCHWFALLSFSEHWQFFCSWQQRISIKNKIGFNLSPIFYHLEQKVEQVSIES